MKENICPICGEGTLRKEIIEEKFEYKGQSTIIPNYIIYHCDVCKETIVDNNTLKQSGKILKNFQRKVDSSCQGILIKQCNVIIQCALIVIEAAIVLPLL